MSVQDTSNYMEKYEAVLEKKCMLRNMRAYSRHYLDIKSPNQEQNPKLSKTLSSYPSKNIFGFAFLGE